MSEIKFSFLSNQLDNLTRLACKPLIGKDLHLIDKITYAYLQFDWQRLQVKTAESEQAEISTLKVPPYLVGNYYVIKNFFVFLYKQGYSTRLQDITSDIVEMFLEREQSRKRSSKNKAHSQGKPKRNNNNNKIQLNAFFERVLQDNLISFNPVMPLLKRPIKLEPRNLSSKMKADYREFKYYLENYSQPPKLASNTIELIIKTLRLLLHDSEIRHTENSSWPFDLDDLFIDPQWIAEWLCQLKNRSLSRKTEVLSQQSIYIHLANIKYVWRFLLSQGRSSEFFYKDLKVELKHRMNIRDQRFSVTDKELKQVDPRTRSYLESDQQRLIAEIEDKSDSDYRITYPKRRLHNYSIIKSFFYFLYEQGKSTWIMDISSDEITEFLEYRRSIPDKKFTLDALTSQPGYSRYIQSKVELDRFFTRAVRNGVIATNPVSALDQKLYKVEPHIFTPQNKADYQAFENYLAVQVDNAIIAASTAERYKRCFRVLLSDVEVFRNENPDWPVELDGLFAHTKWIAMWVRQLGNHSTRKINRLARASINHYLDGIKQIWLFLQTQGRAPKNFYEDLKRNLVIPGTSKAIRLGRSPLIIEALTEKEEEAVFTCIKQFSQNPILKLRDLAIFTTGLQTAIRLDGLHSMNIENVQELDDGTYGCQVKVKRHSYKSEDYIDQLADDNIEWRQWYMSPQAIITITKYLMATGRDWRSEEPIWLGVSSKPLSYYRLRELITRWLDIADCKWKRPHVLRHTAVDRLINKYHYPLPDVQNISQHASIDILLNVYAKRQKIDSFKAINEIFAVEDMEEISAKDLMLSIATDLSKISNDLVLQRHKIYGFSQHGEDLVEILKRQINHLTSFLGYQLKPDLTIISPPSYQYILDVLELAELRIDDVLGYTPQLQREILSEN